MISLEQSLAIDSVDVYISVVYQVHKIYKNLKAVTLNISIFSAVEEFSFGGLIF